MLTRTVEKKQTGREIKKAKRKKKEKKNNESPLNAIAHQPLLPSYVMVSCSEI